MEINTFDEWRKIYLHHPLLQPLAEGLIWTFEHEGTVQVALPRAGSFFGSDGAPIIVADGAQVRLWHPLFSTPEEVHAWRRRIGSLGLTQPLKQAYREVYLLTDAERITADYSNRFAAHIIRQPQYRALGKVREWDIPLDGGWDMVGPAKRRIVAHGLTCEFYTEGVEQALDNTDSASFGSYVSISTDRVLFRDGAGTAVPLTQIPAIIFSELMRDVDLFIGVCSIGNDPTWADGARHNHLFGYWSRTAFAELSGSAAVRREALIELLPMLSIHEQCTMDDRALLVRGKLRNYRIHLGSVNILMEPNSQYLCIVLGKNAAQAPVRLPFEGDAMLSLVLSKAFLLANDDKITDESITRQIGRSVLN